jgi:hypothetical protein
VFSELGHTRRSFCRGSNIGQTRFKVGSMGPLKSEHDKQTSKSAITLRGSKTGAC